MKIELSPNNYEIKIISLCFAFILLFYTYSSLNSLGFASPDDKWSVLHNPLVIGDLLSVEYYTELITSYNSIQYSPLNTLYYAVIYKINKFDPYYFHLGSFFFHLLNTGLVFIISKKIILTLKGIDQFYISLIIGLIWAIHPLNVESVTWIAASKIILCTFFSLLLLNTYLIYLHKRQNKLLFWCAVFYVLSFLCKEQVVVNPLMLLMFKFILDYSKTEKLALRKKDFLFFGILVLLTLFFCYITLDANSTNGQPDISRFPFFQRFFLGFYCLFFYLGNFILPVNLHYHYSFPMRAGESLPLIYYSYVFLFIIIVGSFYSWIKNKLDKFTLLCVGGFIIQIGLCLQFTPLNRPAIVADRYMYLPSFFLILLLVPNLYKFFNQNTKLKIAGITGLLIYLVYFSIYSNLLVFNWQKIMILNL